MNPMFYPGNCGVGIPFDSSTGLVAIMFIDASYGTSVLIFNVMLFFPFFTFK